jgi:hypothetical protein
MDRFNRFLPFCGAAMLGFAPLSMAKLSLDLGAYRESVSQPQSASSIGLFSGVGRVRLQVPLEPFVFFEPSLSLFTPKTLDSARTRSMFTGLIGLDLAYQVFSWARLRVGAGVEMRLAMSEEKPVLLRNGESSSVFYTPGGASFSLRFLAEAGVEFQLGQNYSVGVDFFVSELFAERTRRLHTLGYLGMSL